MFNLTHVVVLTVIFLKPCLANVNKPHILFVVGDDVGYGDLGFFNDKKVNTPTLDNLLEDGIFLSDYYTFKICSPSRAAMITGRYPWAAGFYDMSQDTDHCTTNSTALPQLLKPLGYATHALGVFAHMVLDVCKKCMIFLRALKIYLQQL